MATVQQLTCVMFKELVGMSSKNVLYHTHGMNDWIGVALNLKRNHHWNPVYWVSSPSVRPLISEHFPNCIWHSKYDAARGVPAKGYKREDRFPVDQEMVFDEHFRHYSIGMKMMDRLDPGDIFTHDQRHRHFSFLLSQWYDIIKDLDIDYAIFSQVPHVISDYVIYSVCENLNIPTIMFKEVTPVDGFVYSQRDIHSPPPCLHTQISLTSIPFQIFSQNT